MKRRIQVSATIADDRKTEIGVSSLGKSGQDNTTGRNAVKNQGVDVLRAKNHGEIRACEGTYATLGYHDFITLRRDGIRDRSKRFPE